MIKNFLVYFLIILVSAFFIVLLGFQIFFPVQGNTGVTIVAHDGTILSRDNYHPYSSLNDVPSDIVDMVLIIEDKRFYQHWGVDIYAIMRAVRDNIYSHDIVSGASTLDQQLIKLQHQWYERSWKRKILEMIGAWNLNLLSSKNEILLRYINNVSFLHGVRGFNDACEEYFGKKCDDLWESELLFLIASYQLGDDPFDDFDRIKKRSHELCEHLGKVSCHDWDMKYPTSVYDLHIPGPKRLTHVREYYENKFKHTKGEVIQTKFDVRLYDKIEKLIDQTAPYRSTRGAQDCCVVVLGSDGEVLSMNVCRDYTDPLGGSVNGCLQPRQTGSAIKPFLYMFAMRQLGLSAHSTILDEEVVFYLKNGASYIPRNFDLIYHGEVTLAQALGSSLNVPAVKLLDRVGVGRFLSFLEQLRQVVGHDSNIIKRDVQRFSEDTLGLSVALGTYEMSPLDFAIMWTIFLHHGNRGFRETVLQQKFFDVYGDTIDEIVGILGENRYRTLSFGVDNFLDVDGWFGKTGTSRHFVDGRTCGGRRNQKRIGESENMYEGEENIVCVWMGNYDGAVMRGGGIQTAGLLWRRVVDAL